MVFILRAAPLPCAGMCLLFPWDSPWDSSSERYQVTRLEATSGQL